MTYPDVAGPDAAEDPPGPRGRRAWGDEVLDGPPLPPRPGPDRPLRAGDEEPGPAPEPEALQPTWLEARRAKQAQWKKNAPEWRERLVPKTVLGISVIILA